MKKENTKRLKRKRILDGHRNDSYLVNTSLKKLNSSNNMTIYFSLTLSLLLMSLSFSSGEEELHFFFLFLFGFPICLPRYLMAFEL